MSFIKVGHEQMSYFLQSMEHVTHKKEGICNKKAMSPSISPLHEDRQDSGMYLWNYPICTEGLKHDIRLKQTEYRHMRGVVWTHNWFWRFLYFSATAFCANINCLDPSLSLTSPSSSISPKSPQIRYKSDIACTTNACFVISSVMLYTNLSVIFQNHIYDKNIP